MAEIAATAFAAMASAGTTAASAGASLFSGVTASGTWTAVQGLATIGSMVSLIMSGSASQADYNRQAGVMDTRAAWSELSARGLEINAQQAELKARQSELEAQQYEMAAEADATEIKRDLARKIGAARVAFAGSGLDISGAGDIERGLDEQADYQLGQARTSGVLKAEGARMAAAASRIDAEAIRINAAGQIVSADAMRGEADALRSRATTSLYSSIASAATAGAKYGLDISKRG